MENLPANEKGTLFARDLTPIPQDKKQTDDENLNIFQKILLKSMPFWPEPRSHECHFLSRELSTLYCPLDQSGVAVAGAELTP